MSPSPKCTALIATPSSDVGTIDHSDRSAHRSVVISPVDRKLQFKWFIRSIEMSLFETLPTTAERGTNAGITTDVIRTRSGSLGVRHAGNLFALASHWIQPVGLRTKQQRKRCTRRST